MRPEGISASTKIRLLLGFLAKLNSLEMLSFDKSISRVSRSRISKWEGGTGWVLQPRSKRIQQLLELAIDPTVFVFVFVVALAGIYITNWRLIFIILRKDSQIR